MYSHQQCAVCKVEHWRERREREKRKRIWITQYEGMRRITEIACPDPIYVTEREKETFRDDYELMTHSLILVFTVPLIYDVLKSYDSDKH